MSYDFSNTEPESTQHVSAGTMVRGRGRSRSKGPIGRFVGRRRRYLIDPAYQIRTAIIAVLGMAFVVGIAAGLLHLLHSGAASASPRDVAPDTRWTIFLVAAGASFVAAVFIIEIFETHKTAGMILRVVRGLHRVRTGSWGTRLAFRRHDNFKELETAFNDAARSLCGRAEDDMRYLERIAARLEVSARELEAGNRDGGIALLEQALGDLRGVQKRQRDLLRSAPDVRFEPKI